MEKEFFDLLMESLEDAAAFAKGDTSRADLSELKKQQIRAWDPDYTRVTPQEAQELEEAEASGFVDESEIDWNDLSRYSG